MRDFEINFGDAVAFFECSGCKGTGTERLGHDPEWCRDCGGTGDHPVYFGTWLRNLANVAQAERAFRLGVQLGAAIIATWPTDTGAAWEPNVEGKPAPSSEGSE